MKPIFTVGAEIGKFRYRVQGGGTAYGVMDRSVLAGDRGCHDVQYMYMYTTHMYRGMWDPGCVQIQLTMFWVVWRGIRRGPNMDLFRGLAWACTCIICSYMAHVIYIHV